jgi:hypothetical protein
MKNLILTCLLAIALLSCEDTASTQTGNTTTNITPTYAEILADTNWVEYEDYKEDSVWTPGAAHRFWMRDSNYKKYRHPPYSTILVKSNNTIDSLDNIFNLERKIELDSNQYLLIFDGSEDMRVSSYKMYINLTSGSIAFVNIITPLPIGVPVYTFYASYWVNLVIELPKNYNGVFHIIKSGESNI